jgi:transketolase
LVRLGAIDKRIVVLDADLSKSTKTAGFAKEFPERFIQMGIAEQDMMATAAGLASAGKIVFASSFAMFAAGRAFEQIRNSIAYPKVSVRIAATHAGITVGEDGASHQSIEDVALMRSIPGMTVIIPGDAVETEKAIEASLEYDGPIYLRLGRDALPVINNEDYDFRIGKAVTLREGSDVTLFTCGVMVARALDAADILAKEGIIAKVVNVHTVKPLDGDAVSSAVKETGCAVTCEEHSIIGGLGGAVCEYLSGICPTPVVRLGVNDIFGQSGKPEELMEAYGLTARHIADAARKAIDMKNGGRKCC